MRKTDVFIGLDLGTSQLKGVAADKEGNILIAKKCISPVIKKGGGKFEIDSKKYYFEICKLIKALAVEVQENKYKIRALSMASASGNTLLIGKNGEPLWNAISWQDKRMIGRLKGCFKELDTKLVQEILGWPFLEMFPLAHITWFKEFKKTIFKKTALIGMTSEYAAFRLTGKWGMDPSSATPFYLVDQKKAQYYKPYLDQLNIKRKMLPAIMKANSILGCLTKNASKETGLKREVIVIPGTFDHPACARGAGVLCPGQILLSCGTSWVGFFPVKDRKKILKLKMLADPFLRKKNTWAGMFSIPELGTVIDEAVKEIAGKGRYKLFDVLAGTYNGRLKRITKPSSWSTTFKKMRREEAAFHVMRWLCILMKKKIKELKKIGIKANKVYMAGGPSRSGIWPKIMAETLGVEIRCLNKEYTGAAGAALTASIGAGVFKDEFEAWEKRRENVTVFKPESGIRKKLFNIKEIDKDVYSKELAEFLPEKILDIHSHIWLKKFKIKTESEDRGAEWPKLVAEENSMEDLQATYSLLFPGKKVIPVVFGMPEKYLSLEKTNNYASIAAKKENFPSLLVSTPEWRGKELENRVKTGGFIGLKPYLNFAPGYIKSKDIEIFDFLPKEQLEVASRFGLVIILHIPRPGRLKDPVNIKQLLEIEKRYPEIKLVVAHLGRTYCEEDLGDACKLLVKTKNMMFDFSANTNSEIMEKFLRTFGPGRLVFGSDFPITRMRMKRINENGKYVNLVPPGLYGDVSRDPSMREASAKTIEKMTLFIYEELLAFKKAAQKMKITSKEVEDVFYNNAVKLLGRSL
ncbi:MAG: hypothetical protein A2452_11290 [Candidatus Firestonebacteria bacterium RIFOXYC2_FULL_39_67]|nr:MAG: hypothetical protein A2536_10070 [Candidatus Firestonebacteria bacterium RIFOXYD2_FULL_39_29]OGF54530.1 MAG: hypothetical protein A2452_11290 [Candidatus Firestonebacteria bacterium RIFOXYC2_FULL_39_67]OGF54598.1 MAG: hypothetical protein A2497_07110 [Candidatus Firestonebacteria bacterium RifOxyC12_full_39_7]